MKFVFWLFIFFLLNWTHPALIFSHTDPRLNSSSKSVQVSKNALLPRPSMTAVYLNEPIVIDGRLDEGIWQRVKPATDFIQQMPDEGSPATQKTEVRIVYDDEMIYFGVICYDSSPELIVAKQYNRDFKSRTEDNFHFSLDTYRDKQSGFAFGVTPLGAKRDFQFAGEGVVRNEAWDGVWYAATSRDERGWIAEIGIPLKTLRFKPGKNMVWGTNFVRHIGRTGEHSYWSPIPRRISSLQMIYAGELRGLNVSSPGRNIQIKPFTLGTLERLVQDGSSHASVTAGFDVKYSVTSGINLNLTGNTNFSHVEVDSQQINLTRFSLFFPEKRDFFLESSDTFRLTPSGISGDVIPFFSRRIGLSKKGRPVPVIGGAILAGKMGAKTNFGLLYMRTNDLRDDPVTHETVSPMDFFVGRVRQEYGRHSLGLIAIGRRLDARWSYLAGLDTEISFLRYGRLVGYWLKSNSPELEPGRDQTRYIEVGWKSSFLKLTMSALDLQERFRADVGFIPRVATRKYSSSASIMLNPHWSWAPRINQVIPGASIAYYYSNPENRLETINARASFDIVFRDWSRINLALRHRYELIDQSFLISGKFLVPAGKYTFDVWRIGYQPYAGRPFAPRVSLEHGSFWDGRITSFRLDLTWFKSAGFELGAKYSINDMSLPSGHETLHLMGLQVDFARSTHAFFNMSVQYNTVSQQFLINARLDIIHRPLSHLYITYNELLDLNLGKTLNRALTIKFEYLFSI